MPLLLKHKHIFIHIPKCGGSSIEEKFQEIGDRPIFKNGSIAVINNHTPQHCTYLELKKLNMIPEDYKVFTVVRHPFDRFISEFNYRKTFAKYSKDLDYFSKEFFTTDRWDAHNYSSTSFIEGCEEITILKYENLEQEFLNYFGFPLNKRILVSEKFCDISDLTDNIKDLIYKNWSADFNFYSLA